MKSHGIFKTDKMGKDECIFATFRIGFMTSSDNNNKDAKVKYSDWGQRDTYCNIIKGKYNIITKYKVISF